VQILGLQEVFNGPYFCPSQDAHWYDIAETGSGTDDRADGRVREEVQDGDGRAGLRARAGGRLLQHRRGLRQRRHYLGKYRKNHIPHTSGFWEKYFFKPGNLGYPVFRRASRRSASTSATTVTFPEGARLLGLNGAEIVFNPSATVAGLSQYLWKLEQPAHAVANGYFMACSNRVGTEGALEHRPLLRFVLLRRSARQLPGGGLRRTRTS
jgi:N-carbamoylputrescine amidase